MPLVNARTGGAVAFEVAPLVALSVTGETGLARVTECSFTNVVELSGTEMDWVISSWGDKRESVSCANASLS